MATATKKPPTIRDIAHIFARDVGQQTGFDPRVVYAWEVQEGAYAPGGTKGYNFLNLKPKAGDPYSGVSPGGFEQFKNYQDAETATVARIRAIVLHERPGQKATLAEHVTPASQIGYIAASPWDQAHYGGLGGPQLQATFAGLYGRKALGDPAQQIVTGSEATPQHPAGSTVAQGPLSASDWTSFDLKDAISGATGLFGLLSKLIAFIFSVRFVELVGGAVLILLGLLTLMRGTVASVKP